MNTESVTPTPENEVNADRFINGVGTIRTKYPELFIVGLKLDRSAELDERLAKDRRTGALIRVLNRIGLPPNKTLIAVTIIGELEDARKVESDIDTIAPESNGKIFLRREDRLADLGLAKDVSDTAHQIYSIYQFSSR